MGMGNLIVICSLKLSPYYNKKIQMFTDENKFEICGHQYYIFMCCISNNWVSCDMRLVLWQKQYFCILSGKFMIKSYIACLILSTSIYLCLD